MAQTRALTHICAFTKLRLFSRALNVNPNFNFPISSSHLLHSIFFCSNCSLVRHNRIASSPARLRFIRSRVLCTRTHRTEQLCISFAVFHGETKRECVWLWMQRAMVLLLLINSVAINPQKFHQIPIVHAPHVNRWNEYPRWWFRCDL